MAISGEIIQKLLLLLRPHLQDEKERKGYLIRALGTKADALNLIWSQPVNTFVPEMIKELEAFGEITPGKPALSALLEVIREDVGVDIEARINELLRQLTEELTETPVDGEQVQPRIKQALREQERNQTKTLLSQLTEAVQTIHAKVNFEAIPLKPHARVPELWVQDAGADKAEVYPLLGDHYLLGRSPHSCDIVVRNPVVSQIHLSLERCGRSGQNFVIKDENSINGIYRGRRRLSSHILRHGDVLTLGPPELASAVRIQYVYPLPWYILGICQ